MDKRKKGKKEISIPKGARKLNIGDTIWYWKYAPHSMGCGTIIILCVDTGKKYRVHDYVLKGADPSDIERTKYKSPGSFQILPEEVKSYIKKHLV